MNLDLKNSKDKDQSGEEEDFFEPKTREKIDMLWKECFSPKALWITFKSNWQITLVWAAFFALGFYLASTYYSVAANNLVTEYIQKKCIVGAADNIPKISLINGTIFG